MKYLIFSTLFIFNMSSLAKNYKRVYLTSFYGHLHKSPSRYSAILTGFECGQPFKLKSTTSVFSQVEYSTYKGYIQSKFLSSKKPRNCWQDKYRKFMDNVGLGVSDMYYWARLNDLLIEGEVMP